MGLDMYLTKKKYIGSSRWDEIKKIPFKAKGIDAKTGKEVELSEVTELSITGFDSKSKVIEDACDIKEISFDAGYWRKANQIHNWLVQNIQNGEDDCREYYFDEEKMQELLDIINKILEASELVDGQIVNGQSYKDGQFVNNYEIGKFIKDATVAKELLPTASGFFFGSEGYDQWYIEDLEETKKILEKAIASKDGDFYYQSSW